MKNKNTIQQLLEEKVVEKGNELRFAKPTKKSYDGTKFDRCLSDEYGQFGKFGLITASPTNWIEKIETYCNNNGILPEDLILAHQQFQGGKIKAKTSKSAQKDKKGVESHKNDKSNWAEQYRKSKTGI